jgi:hypothetical protein
MVWGLSSSTLGNNDAGKVSGKLPFLSWLLSVSGLRVHDNVLKVKVSMDEMTECID